MALMFDIFRTDADGSTHWCEAADNLEAAKNRTKELLQATSAQYIIVSQGTGERIVIGEPAPISATKLTKLENASSQAWYHICRVEKEKLRWVEAAETLQVAEARIKVLKAFYPGDYLVLDYNPERSDSPPPWTPLRVLLSALGLITAPGRSVSRQPCDPSKSGKKIPAHRVFP
jgi:hypothetical protein